MTQAVIEADHLTKRWGSTTALDGISFSIGPGVTGLLGANGAGKTTLLGMFLGLHTGTTGDLRVFGLDPATAGSEIRARVGYAPEHHSLPPDIRAHDLVRHIAEVHGLPRREAMARASDTLYQVGLGEERFRPIGTMSTGQRQRVKLAQALAHDPRLMLLDEPTDGLDPVQRDDMLALIKRVGSEFGVDIILSSHLLAEVERVCDSALILNTGRVIAQGTISELVGDSSGMTLDLDGDPAPIGEALERAGLDVVTTGLMMRVDGPNDRDVPGIVRDVLADADVGVRRLTASRRSLSDVFFGDGGV